MIETYEKRNTNPDEFFKARGVSEQLERDMLVKLANLWRGTDDVTYREFSNAYNGEPDSKNFHVFLRQKIAALDAPHRRIEREAKARERTLVMEAFLVSPGKDPAAIHLDGYDSIKAESLRRADPLGLDLSPEELARLEKQVKSSEELARTLEQLRRGELALKDAVDKLAVQAVPEINELISAAEELAKRLDAHTLEARRVKTKNLLNKFLAALAKQNEQLADQKKAGLQIERDWIIQALLGEAEVFRNQLRDFLTTARQLRTDWQKETSSSMGVSLFRKAKGLAQSFNQMKKNYPDLATAIETRVSNFLEESLKAASDAEMEVLKSKEVLDLRADLQQYVRDVKDISAFINKARDTASVLGTQPVPVLPATGAASLQVPLNKIKDTFIDLEQTPRMVGDFITVRATLKDGEQVLDTSLARFQVGRFGHYAEMSPAVVLVKPQQIAGTDTGFRFAPALSWMYHWAPRPEATRTGAYFVRVLDPSIGIHSAFLNFNSPTSSTSAQIGLGVTLAFWKNRLQIGYGYNLMAKSSDEGRNYFFVGSDLIGLLQAIGVAK